MVLPALLAISIVLNLYLVFHETMNKIQYIQTLRVYWITRDVASPGDPIIKRAWMRQTKAPFWRGSGVEIRMRKYTFQFGVLTSKGSTLLDQVGGRELDHTAKDIRKWQ